MEKGKWEVSHNMKTKPDVQTDVSLQVIPRNVTEECIIIAADGYNSDTTMEERKKEANKPIYLRRI